MIQLYVQHKGEMVPVICVHRDLFLQHLAESAEAGGLSGPLCEAMRGIADKYSGDDAVQELHSLLGQFIEKLTEASETLMLAHV